ncbi:MAG: non-canonical purine NTP diphosphatase [Flavobacteriales bacterium]
MKIVFASQNQHKIDEIAALVDDSIQISGLDEYNLKEEIPETGSTLIENALQKARFVAGRFGVNCFADDTGLEVSALNGAPGVYSARYAGEQKNAEANMKKLLLELEGKADRSARFKTVIALLFDGKEYLFEGVMNGTILTERRGSGGFGYDSLFVPEGSSLTFAEMSALEKNKCSHRAKAVEKLITFLNEINA